jgi:hypothetical protein
MSALENAPVSQLLWLLLWLLLLVLVLVLVHQPAQLRML